MSLFFVTNGAALGTGPGAASVGSGSNDTSGVITLTSGTSTASGTLVTFTLATSYNDLNERLAQVQVIPAGASTGGLGLWATITNGNVVTVGCANAPAASTALTFTYQVVT